ncbi:succinylglutamate desuccinylase/aspartoacylase domain-containing protein [Altibacter sp. HG106]|uniref:succinylglutamate desuccinylase/aspartoacylase domain-containing protein n=1 Tax=Altibacter sp. HG106 TaxID=3023937 RepID=UPI002350C6C6|nr:succinylglutamate desuccinylase/aspartoacylase family protein [Altibacter sp. HG106]MDC7995395.1 succinylglutamate desuccinylase/aspartoacylase family protein [Altibacter sp. HG106]
MTKRARIIGNYSSGKKGPLLFVTAAVHGNEPSGVKALQRVFEELKQSKPDIKGTLIGLVGNTTALEEGVRYIDEDLNRTWSESQRENKNNDALSSEEKEMFDIISLLEKHPADAYTQRYFMDCHTTSSDSLPYISVQVVNDNDSWAHAFPIHIIRGFSDIVSGTIDHYLSDQKLTGFVVEAGQHTSKDAVAYHEGMIWLALQKALQLELDRLPKLPTAVEKTETFRNNRKTFEIIYRHGLTEGDTFTMESGFENFQPIEKGVLLAHHNSQPIRSQWDAFIFMPLYQKQGNDGFFVVQEVS